MATKSILKNININQKKLSRNFVIALETAQDVQSKDVKLSRSCKDVKKDEIKDLFRSF